jgi:subtilase family serine protease
MYWTRSAAGLGLLALAATPAFGGQASFSQSNQAMATTLTRTTTLRASAKILGPLAAGKSLHIVVALKLRNQAKLHGFLRQTRSANGAVRHPLTPHQFTARYSPTVTQAEKVAQFLKTAGFSHVTLSADRMLVSGDAPAATVGKAFHTKLVSVSTPGGRLAWANQSAPKVPVSLRGIVLSVLGLQTVHHAHTLNIKAGQRRQQGAHPNARSGHNPTEFASIYDAGNAPTAAGVAIGIVSEGNLNNVLNDLDSFTSQNGLPSVTTQVVNTDGTSGDTSGDGEWDLDSQDIVGMAGGRVGKLIFYNISSLQNTALTDDFNAIVTANKAKIINVSLGECETYAKNDGSAAAQDESFQRAIAQGQTFSVSSGDSGADECGNGGTTPSWPAASQYVVAVGGTTLNTSGSSWNGETVWSGGGGSPSTFEPMPSWQEGVGQNAGHSTRGVPDVAFDANPNTGAIVIVDGRNQQIGGTSLASPLFVGLWARVIAAKGSNVGFAAPLLYKLPSGDFHDVTSGNNGGETAAPGWDYASGFGSMKIADVVADIGGGGGNPPGNQPPTARNGSVTTTENHSVTGTLSASDPDGDALTFSIVNQPSHGSVRITNTSTGAFTYSPGNNYSGSDSFTFRANDGQANSNTATESVTVKPSSSGPCPTGFTHYSGSDIQGYDSYQPDGNYYYASSGVERGRLHGPAGTDFDLYLYKYSAWYGWVLVARSVSATSNESIAYHGSAGYYLWDIYAYSGSGKYNFCLQHP